MNSKLRYPITKPEAVLLNTALGSSILHNLAEFNEAIVGYILNTIGSLEGTLKYSGVVPSAEWSAAVSNHIVGQVFVVKEVGTYVGQSCEVGDFIICNTTADYENATHWDVIQTNIDGAVITEGAVSSNNLVTFISSNVIGDSGIGVGLIEDVIYDVEKLESDIDVINNRITSLTSDLASTNDSVSELNDTLSSSYSQTNTRIDDLTDSIFNETTQIKNDINLLQDLDILLSEDIVTLHAEITNTNNYINDILDDIERLSESNDLLQQTTDLLKDKIDNLNVEIATDDGLIFTSDGKIKVNLAEENTSENFINFEGESGSGKLAVREIKSNATKLSKSITVAGVSGTLGTGYYKNGVTIEAGTDIETILNNLLTLEIYPTTTKNTPSMSASIAAPTITPSISSGSIVEAGTKITIANITTKTSTYSSTASTVSGFTYGYSSADDDSVDSTATSISKSWSITKTSDSYTVTATFTGFGNQSSITNTAKGNASISIPALTVDDGTNKMQLSYSGATFAGTVAEIPQYYIVSNLGNTDSSKMSVKASSTTATKTTSGSATYTITGTRYAFYGSSATAIENTSTGIRGLAQSGTSKSFSVTVEDGSNYVMIAFPSTWGSLKSVADTGAFGTDIVASFGDAIEIQVEGANNYSATTYKVYTYAPSAALGSNKYNVTVS